MWTSTSGRCHTAKLRSAWGDPSPSIASTGRPQSTRRQLGRVADGGAGEAERGFGAVVVAQATQPAEHVGDVAAEHATEGVQLVDDDVAQPQQECRPPLVRREDAHVQHLGVGEQHVGVGPDPRALVDRRVAVVGRSHEVGHEPLAERPELVLREGLGREHEESGVAGAVGDAFDDRDLVAERLPRRGAGRDGDVPACAQRVDRLGLVRPQPVDPTTPQARVDQGRQRASARRRVGGARGEHGVRHDPVEVFVRELAEGHTGVGPWTRRRRRDRANGTAAPRRRRSRRAAKRPRRSSPGCSHRPNRPAAPRSSRWPDRR